MNKKQITTAFIGTLIGASLWGSTVFADQVHKVNPGDTLWGVSQQYEASVTEIKSWNNLNSNAIYIGEPLVVQKDSTPVTEKETPVLTETDSSESSKETVNTYVVQSGDTLEAIANKYGISVSNLKNLNSLSSNRLYVGQQLSVSDEVANQKNESTSSNTTQSTVSNNGLVEEAKKHIGTPYRWGGTSPAGFDCSGFLNYVFAQEGLDLPRTVASIYADDRMSSINLSNAQVGDLIFFETYKAGASHAGIYVGNNQFIHSGSTNGIEISSLSSGYWGPRYIGAKRITNK